MNFRHRTVRHRAMGLVALMISTALGMSAPLGRVHAGAAQAQDHRIYLPALSRTPLRELRPGGSAFGRISAVAAHGDHALVGEGSHVVAYRVGSDGMPRALGRTEPLDGNVVRILWDGGEWAYVVTRAAEARLYPARAPYVAPLAVSVLDAARGVPRLRARNAVVGLVDIQIHASHAFVCGGSGFTVYDLADPTAWRALTTVSLPGGTLASGRFQCRHDGEHVLGVRGDREGNLLRFDVSDPAHPMLLAVDTIAEAVRMNMDDFVISAGQVHSIWCMVPMAGGPQCSYMPSSASPADDPPRLNFLYAERPSAPILRDGMAYVRTYDGPEGPGSLTVVDPRGGGELPRRSRLRLDFPPVDFAIDAGRAWLVGNRQLQVADISDLDAPRALGSLRRPGGVAALAAADGLVFVASVDPPEIQVLRGADAEVAATVTMDKWWGGALATAPAAPLVAVEHGALAVYSADTALRPLGRLNLDQGSLLDPGVTVAGGDTYALRVAAGKAYVVRDSRTLADASQGSAMELDVVDLREPSRPELLSRTVLGRSKPQEYGGVSMIGERVFIATGDLGTVIELDLGDPRAPVQRSTHTVEGGLAGGIAAWGHRLLIAAGTAGLRVVDPADGWRELDRLEGIGRVLDVVVDGGMAYAVTGEGRLVAVELRPDGSIDPAGDLPLPTGGRRLALDGDRLWVDRGDGGASWFEIGGP